MFIQLQEKNSDILWTLVLDRDIVTVKFDSHVLTNA